MIYVDDCLFSLLSIFIVYRQGQEVFNIYSKTNHSVKINLIELLDRLSMQFLYFSLYQCKYMIKFHLKFIYGNCVCYCFIFIHSHDYKNLTLSPGFQSSSCFYNLIREN
jgi:hypothetical protein